MQGYAPQCTVWRRMIRDGLYGKECDVVVHMRGKAVYNMMSRILQLR